MTFAELLKILKRYVSGLLDKEGWSLVFEIKEEIEDKLVLAVNSRYSSNALELGIKPPYIFSVPTFTQLYEQREEVSKKIAQEKQLNHIDSYSVYEFKKSLFIEIGKLFAQSKQLDELYHSVQNNNYSYINSFSVENFFSIDKISFKAIGGAREIYLLGENGDGKSLVLMALHLAFNGRETDWHTNFEFTGKVKDIIKENTNAIYKGVDTNGTHYGNEKAVYLKNFYCYGVHRGRYSSEKYEHYGYMSLYDANEELYSPEKLLTRCYLSEIERERLLTDNKDATGSKSQSISIQTLQTLFRELLENNVTINVSATEVTFIEKGFELSFDNLSDGYKNILIWVSDLIYRLQKDQPYIGRLEEFIGVVLVDEIELHLHPLWQRRLIGQLRKHFAKIQFFFSTHSPTIIQGAGEDAVIYRIFRNSKTGKTNASDAFHKENINHLMLNTLATSPLFGLEDARVSSVCNNTDTSDSYLHSRVTKKIEAELKIRKKSGRPILTDAEIDALIEEVLKQELSANDSNT
jgi:predicted ATP-binding protein involved in virulence